MRRSYERSARAKACLITEAQSEPHLADIERLCPVIEALVKIADQSRRLASSPVQLEPAFGVTTWDRLKRDGAIN